MKCLGAEQVYLEQLKTNLTQENSAAKSKYCKMYEELLKDLSGYSAKDKHHKI